LAVLLVNPTTYLSSPETEMSAESPKSVYDFTYTDIDGNEQSLSRYKDKVLIVVNVASKCGFTNSNYEQLQTLYEKYKDQGLSILGFPCDQFMGQEPKNENEIKEFVCSRFKVTFDLAKKVNVNGADAHPLWTYLKTQIGGYFGMNFIKWNFTKFIINKKGQVVQRYAPTTNPKDFEAEIVQLLNE